jgi:predicted alpha/beta-hydrolase family hydrolase
LGVGHEADNLIMETMVMLRSTKSEAMAKLTELEYRRRRRRRTRRRRKSRRERERDDEVIQHPLEHYSIALKMETALSSANLEQSYYSTRCSK